MRRNTLMIVLSWLALLLFEPTSTVVEAFATPVASRRALLLPSSSAFALLSSDTTALFAKKRRRRKSKAGSPASSASPVMDDSDDDDLPDFDLVEEVAVEELAAPKKKVSTPPQVIGTTPEGETITANMMASPQSAVAPSKSVRDLINDRSLEQKLTFDDDGDNVGGGEGLPDLMQMARSRSASSQQEPDFTAQPSKKKARQAARQAAAAARQAEEEAPSLDSLLASVPMFVDENTGKVTPLKILEAGTWLGIGLLVVWELYINSPFFERAAPITPVVFE